jgi:hypothetical protein
MKNFQFAVSTVVALVGAAILLRAAGMGGFGENSYTVTSSPTPYSEAHALVQSRAGEPEEQPPTF